MSRTSRNVRQGPLTTQRLNQTKTDRSLSGLFLLGDLTEADPISVEVVVQADS
jgi:hypothetical protein